MIIEYDVSDECYVRIHQHVAAVWTGSHRNGPWLDHPIEGSVEAANEEGFHPYNKEE